MGEELSMRARESRLYFVAATIRRYWTKRLLHTNDSAVDLIHHEVMALE